MKNTFNIDIQIEINSRLDAIEKKLSMHKYQDKKDFLMGGYRELQDLKEWIQDEIIK